jgi:tetratricopeptide (TPR) repeat protein
MRVNTIVGLVLLPVVLSAAPAPPPHEAIFEMSESAPRDAGVQKKALAAIDAQIAKQPKEALCHFVRGKILSRLGRDADSLAAYDEAVRLDEKLANAHYNAGVVLGRLGRKNEAAERFDRALEIEPLPDAAYNAGQAYYDLKDFEKALKRFERAHKLAPGDFDSARR